MFAELTEELKAAFVESSNPILIGLRRVESAVKAQDLEAVVRTTVDALNWLASYKLIKKALTRPIAKLKSADLEGDTQEPNWRAMSEGAADAVKIWERQKRHTEAAKVRVMAEVVAALADMLKDAGTRDPWIAGRDLSILSAEMETYALKLAKKAGKG